MHKKRLHFLLINDDGIDSPGLQHLWEALHQTDMADLTVIAPLQEQSGTGVSISAKKPLLIKKVSWPKSQAWTIDGTPADCVKMGIRLLLNHPPDFIFSGINAGSNAGRNLFYSGTIGGVIEGVLNGIPGAAFSCESLTHPNFTLAKKYIAPLVTYILHHPLPKGSFLNINFPQGVTKAVKGFRLTRQGKSRWAEDPSLHSHTENGKKYWLGARLEQAEEENDSDITLLQQGYLTAVPLHVHELTDRSVLLKKQKIFQNFFQI